ncbi:hypothetical protein [Vampirovibrio sp.]|uniref:hypothetical protein n=1 Tax=Vampirovibrio sp. TaxID=2717857 RepID=UPI00359326EF
MNPYTAGNLARTDQAGQPLIQKLSKEEGLQALQEEQRGYPQADEDASGETFSEEDAEEILLFAKMRGLMNVSLQSGKRYEFRINPQTGMVELTELDSGALVMQLTPVELMRLSEKLQRYAGMLTDLSG